MKNNPIKIEPTPTLGKVPLCERTNLTDEEKKLFTIDDLYARGSGNIYDSIWAPGNEKLAAGKIEARRAASININREPLNTIKVTNQHSLVPHPGSGLNSGLGVSRYSGNAPKTPSALTHAVAPTPTLLPPHLRGMEKQSPVAGRVNNQQFHVDGSNIGGFGVESTVPAVSGVHIAPSVPDRAKDQNFGAPPIGNTQSAMSSLQEPQKAISAEDAFMVYLNKKATANAISKKAAKSQIPQQMANTTPVTRNSVTSTNTWSQPSVARIGEPRHEHFRVDVESQGVESFQDFMKKKAQAGPKNGKHYAISAVQNTEAQKLTAPEFLGSVETQAAVQETNKQGVPMFNLDLRARVGPKYLPKEGILINKPLGEADIRPSLDTAVAAFQAVMTDQEQIIPRHTGAGQLQSTQQVQHLVVSPKFSASALSDPSGGWEMPGFSKQAIVNESIFQEISTVNGLDDDTGPLTEEAMLAAWGVVPRQPDNSSKFRISDDGIGAEEKEKENVRGTQGRDATEELLDWDRTWLPPPCVWEDRGTFDTGFIPDYIRKDWQPSLVAGPVQFDLPTPDFKYGRSAVNNLKLDAPIHHMETIPAIEKQENESKRLNQTSEIEARKFVGRLEKMNRSSKKLALQASSYKKEFESFEPPPNPFAPAIKIYLRPATANDAADIAEIYNFYVQNSMITEDQIPVDVADFQKMVTYCNSDNLPFIVAVKGSLLPELVPRPRKTRKNVVFPQNETIIGFALAQAFNVGFGGLRKGRSRTTADVQLYVHNDYTRKGVGRCLLDRIAQCLSFAYGGKDGYPWVNPRDDQVYKAGGAEYWHQLIIQLPVKAKENPPVWLANFLRKYWFLEDGRLQGVGRTPAYSCLSEFVDVVLFINVATVASEFPTTV